MAKENKLIISPDTIALYKSFLTEPEKHGCTYEPIGEVLEEFDGCTPKHVLYEEYTDYINKPLHKAMFYIIMGELYSHLECTTEPKDKQDPRYLGYRLRLKDKYKTKKND